MHKSIVEYLNDDGLAELYKNGYLGIAWTDKLSKGTDCDGDYTQITPEKVSKNIEPITAMVCEESRTLAEKINEIIYKLNQLENDKTKDIKEV